MDLDESVDWAVVTVAFVEKVRDFDGSRALDRCDNGFECDGVETDTCRRVGELLSVKTNGVLRLTVVGRRDHQKPAGAVEAVFDHCMCKHVLPPELLQRVHAQGWVVGIFVEAAAPRELVVARPNAGRRLAHAFAVLELDGDKAVAAVARAAFKNGVECRPVERKSWMASCGRMFEQDVGDAVNEVGTKESQDPGSETQIQFQRTEGVEYCGS